MYLVGLAIIFMATTFYRILKQAPINDSADKNNYIILIFTVGALVWAALLMSSLTVKIDADFVRAIFGMGMFRKKFALKDIIYCRTVKNRWWHGWGIHMCKGGWLYNVSGFDAVEITMKSGKKNRIGTDEPEKLAEAMATAIREKG